MSESELLTKFESLINTHNHDIESLNRFVKENYNQLLLSKKGLILLGEYYSKIQEMGKAINHYNLCLEKFGRDSAVENRIKFLQGILDMGKNDIYDSTNLNLDPWLD